MPDPCKRCGGTGVIETTAGTDASGITLLSPQPCSCAAPSWADESAPEPIDTREMILRWLRQGDTVFIWRDGPTAPVARELLRDGLVTLEAAGANQLEVKLRLNAIDAHMGALPPDQAERQWMDLSEMMEDEDDR